MVNGDIPPRVKKDAHAVILEFIRSRPPLKKVCIYLALFFLTATFLSISPFQASERQLGPPLKCTPTPREQLMESIRKGKELKQITPPETPTLREKSK